MINTIMVLFWCLVAFVAGLFVGAAFVLRR